MTAAAQQSLSDVSHLRIATLETSGGTILRAIGDFRVETSGATADHVDIDVGIIVASTDAFNAAAVPDPNLDPTTDWYFWRHLDQHLPGNLSDSMNQGIISWDIRSSRRLKSEERLVFVINKSASTFILNMSLSMRGLWTLQA